MSIIVPGTPERRGRPRIFSDRALTSAETSRRSRATAAKDRESRIAILDMETDPFDKVAETEVRPFAACLYSDEWEPIVIWEEDFDTFVSRVIGAIEALPEAYTIYAHNGGKFDFMFLVHRIRGQISFKGRGIMSAKIGSHELRDSFHIIPEKLANLQKDAFDYSKMKRDKRNKHREEITRYLINDCRYLLDYVKAFVGAHGLKLSIGQAAMYELKKHYKVKSLGEQSDAYLRNFFFGGRVECLAGMGHFVGQYKMYDVNSMYPFVMATRQHPIGNSYQVRRGSPGPYTVFVVLACRNYGAFVKRGDMGETSANYARGRFLVSIWEYDTAVRLNLVDDIQIEYVVDCEERSDFSNFILPLYEKRRLTKNKLKAMKAAGDTTSREYNDTKKDDIFTKLLMNNAYGKFAQNPRRFKESYVTDNDARPPAELVGYGELPVFRSDTFAIWERPAPDLRFNNVGTAASITGAARAVLMEAIVKARDPIYCDTDSLICKSLDMPLNDSELGYWALEQEFSEVLIAGKKLYAGRAAGQSGPDKIRSKGVSDLTWTDIERMLEGHTIESVNKAPTLTKRGADAQFYMHRSVRATAPQSPSMIRERMLTL
jgi:hypothetical protein